MDMMKIACLGLSGVLLGILLKQMNSPFADLVSLGTCLLIIFYAVSKLGFVLELLGGLQDRINLEAGYFKILMKITGITYLADFSSSLCRDAGYSAIAGQIEMFGKISVLAISSPIVLTLIETIYSFL
ncbi:MAG: SpoIIIAC/SpoIIIAD family protein [Lachnospiraceae bacterium]|nr:SpoIIIAC/SpoIIIAD family protein [Lachnospiraceae bacterium]